MDINGVNIIEKINWLDYLNFDWVFFLNICFFCDIFNI